MLCEGNSNQWELPVYLEICGQLIPVLGMPMGWRTVGEAGRRLKENNAQKPEAEKGAKHHNANAYRSLRKPAFPPHRLLCRRQPCRA